MPMTPVPMMSINSLYHGPWNSHESHPGEIFMPSSGWKDDVLANIKKNDKIQHRVWKV